MSHTPRAAKKVTVEAATNGWIVSRPMEGVYHPAANFVCANPQEAAAVVHQLITTGQVNLSNNSAIPGAAPSTFSLSQNDNPHQEIERLRTAIGDTVRLGQVRLRTALDKIAELESQGSPGALSAAHEEIEDLRRQLKASRHYHDRAKTQRDAIQAQLDTLSKHLVTAAKAWDLGYEAGKSDAQQNPS